MEGDVAPLPEIVELCERFGARLMVDEAHALGVLGARGAGTCELLGVEDRVDLRMATFSKSLASCGGVIAGPADVVEFLRIQSRPFMFTASAVPAAIGAALAAVRICRSSEGPELFARVLDNARYLHRGLTRARASGSSSRRGSQTGREVVTPVVPVVVGDDWKAALLWKALYDAGLYVNVALHPAVPPAGALLRTSVMATHEHRHARPRDRDLRRQSSASSRPSTARSPVGPETPRTATRRLPRGPEPYPDDRLCSQPTSDLFTSACPLLHKSCAGEKTRSKRMGERDVTLLLPARSR